MASIWQVFDKYLGNCWQVFSKHFVIFGQIVSGKFLASIDVDHEIMHFELNICDL
jgi:hypothetical protein